MGYWMFLFVCNLLIPVTMILVGRRYYKKPLKEINSLSGYRTTRSMQNQETWIYANTYIGKLWWKVGWILIIPTALAQLPFTNSSTNEIGILSLVIVFVQLLIMLLTIIPTERALKKNFNKDGTAR